MPQLKSDVCWSDNCLHFEVDPMIHFASIPPMSVLQLKVLQWNFTKVRIDFACLATCYMVLAT